MKFQANEQNLRHDKPDGLEGLGGEHEDEPQDTHVDFPIGCHGCPQGNQDHCNYKPAGGVLQTSYEERHHCNHWRESLQST